ncbi:MAG: DnaJ domain-containing protein [Gammaproteobacteria bacterium]|nr:DnaJ domain-containing protein [Gammaproteobacteria bacterium]
MDRAAVEAAIKLAFSQLGITKSADKTHDHARKAYLELAKTHHPDKGGEEERFKIIGHAWTLIQSEMPKAVASTYNTACAFAYAGAGTSAARHEHTAD